MPGEPLESIIAELSSQNWVEAGHAIRKVLPHAKNVAPALPALFQLTFHPKPPLAADSAAIIKRLGIYAVPFLRHQAIDAREEFRTMAISLLTETGCRWTASTRMLEQQHAPRNQRLPDWGCDPEEIIALFRDALSDASLTVRFTAARALEEFGRHLEESVPVFIDVLQNGTQLQQNWASLYLGRIGPLAAPACAALAIATQSTCRSTALAASNAIARIGDAGSNI